MCYSYIVIGDPGPAGERGVAVCTEQKSRHAGVASYD